MTSQRVISALTTTTADFTNIYSKTCFKQNSCHAQMQAVTSHNQNNSRLLVHYNLLLLYHKHTKTCCPFLLCFSTCPYSSGYWTCISLKQQKEIISPTDDAASCMVQCTKGVTARAERPARWAQK